MHAEEPSAGRHNCPPHMVSGPINPCFLAWLYVQTAENSWHDRCVSTSVAVLPRNKPLSQVHPGPLTPLPPSGRKAGKVTGKPQPNSKGTILNFDLILTQPASVSHQDDGPKLQLAEGSPQPGPGVDVLSCQTRQIDPDQSDPGTGTSHQGHNQRLLARIRINTADAMRLEDGSKDHRKSDCTHVGSDRSPLLQAKDASQIAHPRGLTRANLKLLPRSNAARQQATEQPSPVTPVAAPVHPGLASGVNGAQAVSQEILSKAKAGKLIVDLPVVQCSRPRPDHRIGQFFSRPSDTLAPDKPASLVIQDPSGTQPVNIDRVGPFIHRRPSPPRPSRSVEDLVSRSVEDHHDLRSGLVDQGPSQPRPAGQVTFKYIQPDSVPSGQEVPKESNSLLAVTTPNGPKVGPKDGPVIIGPAQTVRSVEPVQALYATPDMALWLGPDQRPLVEPIQPDQSRPNVPDITGLQQQLIEQMRVALDRGQHSVTVELYPPELGRVVIIFEHRENVLTGRLEVSDRQTYLGLGESAKEIITNLLAQGIQLRQLDITLTPQDLSSPGYEHGHSQDGLNQPWRDQAYTTQTDQTGLTTALRQTEQPGFYIRSDGSIDMLA